MKQSVIILLSFALMYVLPLWSQTKRTLYTVRDAVTSEPITDCSISYSEGEDNKHQLTSPYGTFYAEDGQSVSLTFSHVSYESKTLSLSEIDNHTIYLIPKQVQLNEVIMYSAGNNANRGSSFRYTPLQAVSSISVIGEPDVLRHISSLPGVAQGIESSLGLFVRGGNNGSNGLYFNDVPMYVSTHLMGMVSVFPPDMVRETAFYMGGLPSAKGNQSSSILDVSVKRQYGAKFNGKIALSPYLSGVYTSLPIIKDKLSVQFSGRSSFAPYLINVFNKGSIKFNIQVFDIASTIDYRVSKNHYLDAMFFTTNDYFGSSQHSRTFAENWRSSTGKLGWRSTLGEKLSLYAWAYYTTAYSAQTNINKYEGATKDSQIGLSSSLDEWAVNARMHYTFSHKLQLNAGASIQQQVFKPGNQKYMTGKSDINHVEYLPNSLFALFCEATYSMNKYMDLRLGCRHTFVETKDSNYSNLDVHFLIHLFLTSNLGMELTFDRLNQYYHILEGLPTGWSMNIMTPGSHKFPAELTHQYYSGFFWKKNYKGLQINLSVGGYYRNMQNIVSYINAINAFGLNTNSWEEEIVSGCGKSFGLELSGSLQGSRLSSTLAYTLSKTDRLYPAINHGNTFPFKFDRRHILNLQTKFTFSKHTTSKGRVIEHIINTVIAYSSGNWATLTIGNYQGVAPPYWEQLMPGQTFPNDFFYNIYDRQIMSSKNGYKMKDYFRIDAAYTLKRVGFKTTSEFSFSIFNVLNRHNPYSYFREDGEWKQLSIVPIMPSIRWTLLW